jgi:hypothetical protein
MRQNDRTLALALERAQEMEQKSIVSILVRGNAVGEAPVRVFGRIEAVAPGFWRRTADWPPRSRIV